MSWGTTANNVIATDAKFLGLGENPPGSNNNVITQYYGMVGEPWCAMYIAYGFHLNGVDLARELTPEFPSTIACMEAAKAKGLWHDGDAGIQRGDLLLMRFPNGDPGPVNHIGIVTQAATIITTLEGNLDNEVRQAARVRGGSNPELVGYIRPPYAGASVVPPVTNPPAFPGRDKFVLGQSNQYVTMLGYALVRKGFGSHYRVGPGPTFTEADRLNVQDFQHAQGWTGDQLGGDSDGYPGPETWRRLFS
jgi:hypothetical protein